MEHVEGQVIDLLKTIEDPEESLDACAAIVALIADHGIAAEDAIRILKSNFHYVPMDVLFNVLGVSFLNIEQYDYVIPFLQESLAINPLYSDALYNLGYVLHLAGSNELALKYLEKIENKSDDVMDLIEEITEVLHPAFLKEYNVQHVNVPNIANPVCVRMDTTDPYVFKQIFQFQEYQLPQLPFTPRFIIDAGANVGYASVWFANLYPNAKIVAVEPEKSNVDILKYNIAPYKQVTAIHSGLWNKDTYLNVRDTGRGNWGIMVEEVAEPTSISFKAVTIESILEQSAFEDIDILKLDVEGAEREIFSSGYESWLGKVKVLIIELHDRMKQGCSKSFFKAVSNYDFAVSIRGENLILTRTEYFQ
jgi:FkbM family methyltransferase